jgi:hypothetical protein
VIKPAYYSVADKAIFNSETGKFSRKARLVVVDVTVHIERYELKRRLSEHRPEFTLLCRVLLTTVITYHLYSNLIFIQSDSVHYSHLPARIVNENTFFRDFKNCSIHSNKGRVRLIRTICVLSKNTCAVPEA